MNPPGEPSAPGGPSVRFVDDDVDRIELRWLANFAGDGKVQEAAARAALRFERVVEAVPARSRS